MYGLEAEDTIILGKSGEEESLGDSSSSFCYILCQTDCETPGKIILANVRIIGTICEKEVQAVNVDMGDIP